MKNRYDWEKMVAYYELCKGVKFNHNDKWYNYCLDTVKFFGLWKLD